VVEVNNVGDVILPDARTIGAMADPGRYELVEQLRKIGPASVAELAASSGTGEAETRAMLAILADAELVTVDGDRWSAVGRGMLLEIPDDPEGQRAARELATIVLLRNEHIPRRWAENDEPRLDTAWMRAAGMMNARLRMTPAELDELQQQIERLIEPYVNRGPADATGSVRLLAYFLPLA
jgi:hypothetical protein